MFVSLSGYRTTRLVRASAHGAVYEAERQRDGKRVLAKVFDIVHDGDQAQVEHEFRLLQQLDVDGVVKPIGIERVGRQIVLLLDYVDGQNLAESAAGRPLAVDEFLPRAREMTEVLGRIHARRVIHRDIKPSNVLIESATNRVVFADFGISVLLEGERARPHDPDVLSGTLPYISPEQTGRTKGEIDFRSDLYSLGVTFYELLTGRRPFESRAPLELIHAHLAQRPQPPHELVATIPPQLSAIVMKLVEKAPERRYQSAAGLAADLERVAGGELEFALGERDFATHLQLPHQVYGRERERALLDDALANIIDGGVEGGRRSLVLLSGPAGSGKSTLVRGYAAALGEHGGYLGIGKFEPRVAGASVGEQPYRGFGEALAGVMRQLLGESEVQLARWGQRLREALGPIAAVVGALVPELALIIGEMSPVPAVELGEARNRLHLAIARLIATLSEDRPLVLVLDDLQWADYASLELLEWLLADGGSGLLLVGSYRSEAVDEQHPLTQMRARLCTADVPLVDVELPPLSNHAIEQLLTDALGSTREAVAALAELIGRKTSNNPMFVRHYLVHLAEVGLLCASEQGWRWDLDAVAAATIPDDLLGVMRAKLERLPAREREVLQVAACIGTRFETALLQAVMRSDPEQLAAALWELDLAGLIARDGEAWCFVHDRIQEAARAELTADQRRALHLAIGRRLLELDAEQVFEIVDQLEQAVEQLDELEPNERERFARMSLDAGRLSLDAAAWRSAARYFELAVAAFGERRTPEMFEAHFGRAQTLALTGEAKAAEAAFAELHAWDVGIEQHARVTARRVRILALQERLDDAIAEGRRGLARIGVALPIKIGPLRMLVAALSTWRKVKRLDADALLAMPECRSAQINAALEVLAAISGPLFAIDPLLYVYTAALQVRMTVEHGFHDNAPETFSLLAFALAGMGEVADAMRACEAMLDVSERRPVRVSAAVALRINMVALVGPAARPYRVGVQDVEGVFARALEIGDRMGAGYVGALGLVMHIEAGTHLAEVLALDADMRERLPDFGTRETLVIATLGQRFAATLAAESDDDEPGFVGVDEYADWQLSDVTRYAMIVTRVWGHMMFEEHERARELLDPIVGDYERVLFGIWVVPRAAVFDGIVTAERARAAHGLERRRLLARVRKRLATARKWASNCVENYGPNVDIIVGELCWARGRVREALDAFERARAAAAEHGRVYLEVLACMRLAALAGAHGWGPVRDGALGSAHAALVRWGAWAPAHRLEREHPELIVESSSRWRSLGSSSLGSAVMRDLSNGLSRSSGDLHSVDSVSSLDLQSLLQTVQAIGEDLQLDEVITRVLGAAIENAGADRGALLLEQAGTMALVAEGQGTSTTAFFDQAVALRDAGERIATSLVHFVLRTGEATVVDDARSDPHYAADAYVADSGVRSLLCIPIVKQQQRVGALLLENHLTAGAFTAARVETLRLLLGQAAGALDNARLYAKLARSEAQWRSLVAGVPDIITLTDEQGRLEFINHLPAGAGVELEGRLLDSFMDASSAADWRAAFNHVVATGHMRELEICIAPTGQPRRFFITRIVAIDPGHRAAPRRYMTISTDITERKSFEAQLRQQQRLESVGTLASGVAHEINNPIQGILNYAELLVERADDPETVREFAGEITHESDRVAAIVRNLLAFSRQDAAQAFELVPVSRVIEDTLSLIRAVLRKDQIALELDIAADVPPVPCRMQQVQQIIMNLVANARDALNDRYPEYHEAKRIYIRARRLERDGHAHPWVRISVEDRAGGIPDQVLARIFDPFFTTKGRERGTGLGLAVSHGIAVDHGGELSVETRARHGSVFHLTLPGR